MCIYTTCFIFTGKLTTQSTASITGQQDTSYTNYSAYQSTRKTHSAIKLGAELKTVAVVEERNISYTAIANQNLLIDAFYPKVKSKHKNTAIVIINGGGWRSGNRTQHYPVAQKLAQLGYACFTP